jgi:catechol 2,3-dioxygenase-like lactoylglutathione lyase family enzyme
MHIEHVNMTVTDLDTSIAFYCDLLDIHVRWKGPIDGEHLGAHIGDDRSYLALFQAVTDGEVDHDLDEARGRLERLGAHVHFAPEYEPGRRIYFLDPSGHEVELVEY